MQTLEIKNKTYLLDDDGFLLDQRQWDEDFANAAAPALGITRGLTPSHWNVLNFIRRAYRDTGVCPLVYKTCRANRLSLKDLQRLFPTGYQRGACKLAGLSFMSAVLKQAELQFRRETRKRDPAPSLVAQPPFPAQKSPVKTIPLQQRVYRVNVYGYLIDPDDWDEQFALFKACELQMSEPLGEKHWRILRRMRAHYKKDGQIPTVYATCEAAGIDTDELAQLFPTGYHRGAVKLAGLNPVSSQRVKPADK